MRNAGIREVLIVIREGKWDIPQSFRDGRTLDMHLGYLLSTVPWGVPYTLDQAYPFLRDARVALGFPDILFHGDDAYERVIRRQAQTGADIVLGIFPADRPSTMDVVDIDHLGRARRIVSKPAQTDLANTWGIAIWAPSFSEYLHEYLARLPVPSGNQTELSIGEVMQAGIEKGLRVEGIEVSNQPFLDIGIPENLADVLAQHPIDR